MLISDCKVTHFYSIRAQKIRYFFIFTIFIVIIDQNPTIICIFAENMENKQRIIFIINPISGTENKDEIPRLISEHLDQEHFNYEVRFTEYAGHAAEIARQSATENVDIAVAVGGDGTINEVARSLVHTETALGIIPCGSGNGLARHLCIPIDTTKAIELINQCQIEAFDYGVINDLPFFCTCGMGFDAFISLKFAEAGKRGPITYVENVLKEAVYHKAFLIACANASQYGNNAYIAPGATMRDGMMDVIIMEPFTALDAPQIAADLFMKTLQNNSKIKTFRAKSIRIHRKQPGAIHYDGDPIMTGTDVDVHIEHLGIRILTNPEATEDITPPNPVLNAFSDFFNNINNVREDIGSGIEKGGRKIQAINKVLLRKLRS